MTAAVPTRTAPALPIRVLVVEDDAALCAAFAAAVQGAPDAEIAGIAYTRADALAMLRTCGANLLLVDLGLPDGSGIDVIEAMQRELPGCSAIVSSVFGDEQHVVQAIQAGASGYLLKDSGPEAVLEQLRSVHQGGSPISPIIARSVLRLLQRIDGVTARQVPAAPAASEDTTRLSPRETRVLELVAKGFTFDEISQQLNVSRHTVMTFVRRIYAKLEVNSKMGAVNEARRQGLLPR